MPVKKYREEVRAQSEGGGVKASKGHLLHVRGRISDKRNPQKKAAKPKQNHQNGENFSEAYTISWVQEGKEGN